MKLEFNRAHVQVTLMAALSVAVVVGLLAAGLSMDPKVSPQAVVGKQAKGFEVVRLAGAQTEVAQDEALRLADFAGQPVIVNFWASWCLSCRSEAAALEQFWDKHQASGVQVVGIAIQDDLPQVQEFIRQSGKDYALGFDATGAAAIDYGVTGVPETFFIDREGIIRHKESGALTSLAALEAHLPSIMAASRSQGGTL